jgi:hypothetical protein
MSSREEFIHKLVTDKKAFDAFVYTPWQEAIKELEKRRADPVLKAYVDKVLVHGVPEVMREKKNVAIFRHIATPNYEVSRFMAVADVLQDHKAVILEYTGDQFNNRNEGKYFLGKLRFQKGHGKDGSAIYEHATIIDFNASNNKPLSSLTTKWGQSLVDFHHELFAVRFKNSSRYSIYDLSNWLHKYGTSAKQYYKPFLALFLQNGILFENFLIEKNELGFTEKVILPAFLEIMDEAEIRPLVVALEPTDVEGDEFWLSHSHQDQHGVSKKLNDIEASTVQNNKN